MYFSKSQRMQSKSTSTLILVITFLWQSSLCAQGAEYLREELQEWISRSATPIDLTDLSPTIIDFSQVSNMVGDAKIVALSESIHGSKEPMLFRNELFKLLVEELNFEAIALESGVVESKVLNDFVTNGEGELDSLFERGITNGFDGLQQNQELVYWIRDYNQQLPASSRKLQIFGFDVSGNPYDNSAVRNPDTAIRTALDYLKLVDSSAAAEFSEKFEHFLPVLAGIFDYGQLPPGERNSLTSSTNDLVSLFQRNRFQYIASSGEYEYEWGARAAVAARQIDSWFREIPTDWEPSDGFAWNENSQEVRDHIMFENLDWILDQISSDGRLVVFASVSHVSSLQTTFVNEDQSKTVSIPFGMYARAKYGNHFVNMLNLTVNGEIKICNMPEDERVTMTLNPPPEDSIEAMFANQDFTNYMLDLRSAPAPILEWLEQEHLHWNGFGALALPVVPAFDIAVYLSPGTPDCAN